MKLAETMERVALAALRSGRRPEEVVVVAVGKTFSPEILMTVYDAGRQKRA